MSTGEADIRKAFARMYKRHLLTLADEMGAAGFSERMRHEDICKKLIAVVPTDKLRAKLEIGKPVSVRRFFRGLRRNKRVHQVGFWGSILIGGVYCIAGIAGSWVAPPPSEIVAGQELQKRQLQDLNKAAADLKAEQRKNSERLNQILERDDHLRSEMHRMIRIAENYADAREESYANMSRGIVQLATDLKELLNDYYSTIDITQLSAEQLDRLAIAEARVAIVEGRYRDALESVSDKNLEIDPILHLSEVDYAYTAAELRAEAFYRLSDWSAALEIYIQLHDARKEELGVASNLANCLYYLGRNRECLTVYSAVLDRIQSEFRHNGEWEDSSLVASVFANRAGAYESAGKNNAALVDISVAISMFSAISGKKGHPQTWLDLAKCLIRRAGIHFNLGERRKGMADYDRVLNIVYPSLVEKEIISRDSFDVAMAHHDRATALFEMGEYRLANDDIEKALSILSKDQRSGTSGDSELLIHCTMLRGFVRANLGLVDESYADFNESVHLAESSEQTRGSIDEAFTRAMVRIGRGNLYLRQHRWIDAARDYQISIRRLRDLLKEFPMCGPKYKYTLATCSLSYCEALISIYRATESQDAIKEAMSAAKYSVDVRKKRAVVEMTAESYRLVVDALTTYAQVALLSGDEALALRLSDDSLDLCGKMPGEDDDGDTEAIYANTLVNHGYLIFECRADVEMALSFIDNGIERQRAICEISGSNEHRFSLALMLQVKGQVSEAEEAESPLKESAAILKQLGRNVGSRLVQPHLDKTLRLLREMQSSE